METCLSTTKTILWSVYGSTYWFPSNSSIL